ncbi:hypothetical protein SEPCBS57363_005934 [Sporothrix epigloea]|uniref:non-specific serine/threonine protein kinase n=1 Tax=Sporothrix epigloea TaxID=1892477 RepID=A0ABP0E0A0_9PEZI
MDFSQEKLLSNSDKDYFDRLPPFRFCGTKVAYVEDTQKYAPGGYHPVDIGDVISSGEREYEVIHKLGHGGFATVWLVRSGVQSTSYHALKILCADGDDYVDPELAIFEHLKKVAAAGHPNVVDLHDSFKITGPNGEHKCLVLPVLGPALELMQDSATIPIAVRHDMCRQVASATAFLHHHGVCHGGEHNSVSTSDQ